MPLLAKDVTAASEAPCRSTLSLVRIPSRRAEGSRRGSIRRSRRSGLLAAPVRVAANRIVSTARDLVGRYDEGARGYPRHRSNISLIVAVRSAARRATWSTAALVRARRRAPLSIHARDFVLGAGYESTRSRSRRPRWKGRGCAPGAPLRDPLRFELALDTLVAAAGTRCASSTSSSVRRGAACCCVAHRGERPLQASPHSPARQPHNHADGLRAQTSVAEPGY